MPRNVTMHSRKLHLLITVLLHGCMASNAPGSDSEGDTTDISQVCDSTAPTYTACVQPLMSKNCLGCHSSSRTGSARQGAPASVNFDTEADVQSWADRISARAVSEGTMPPS